MNRNLISFLIVLLSACSESPKEILKQHQDINADNHQSHSTVQQSTQKKKSSNFEYTFLGFEDGEQAFLKEILPKALSEKSYISKERLISLQKIPDQTCEIFWGEYKYNQVDGDVMHLSIFEAPGNNNMEMRKILVSKSEALYCPKISDDGYNFETANFMTKNRGRLVLSPNFTVKLHEAPERCKPDTPTKGVVSANGIKYKIVWPEAVGQFADDFQTAQFLRCQDKGYAQVRIADETKHKIALLNWSRSDFKWPDKKISEILDDCDDLKFCEDNGHHITLGPSIDIFEPIEFGFYRTNTQFGVMNFAYLRVRNSSEASFVTRSLNGIAITVTIPISDWGINSDENSEIDELVEELFASIEIEK